MVHTDGAPQLWMMFPMMSLRSEMLGGTKGGGCLETLLTSKRFGVNPGRFGDLVLGIRLPGNELKDFLFVLMF